MSLDLLPVRTSREMSRFIDVPWRIDRALGGDSHWVPPLRIAVKAALDPRHPFWRQNQRQLWIALRNGEPVGRIAAIVNTEHRRHWGDDAGFWGFFETVDDQEVTGALLRTAAEWLREQGSGSAVGPVSPSPHYEMGILTAGFEMPPYLMLAYNPPYYPALIAAAGYEKAADLYAYRMPVDGVQLQGKIERVSEMLERRRGLTIRATERRHFDRDAAIIRGLYNASMEGQWGFTPLGESEFAAFAADLQRIVDPDLVLIAESRGEPVGFLLALPNLNEIFIRIRSGRLFPFGLFQLLWNRRHVRSLRVILTGMLPEWQRRGVGSLLYREIAHRARAKGYTAAELSWVLEENALMNRAIHLLGGSVYKTYRVYRKNLQ